MSSASVPAESSSPAAAAGASGEHDASRIAEGAAGTTGESGEGAAPSDYLGRIRSDGEFAAGEVRKYQSRATQAEERLRKMGDLASWAEQVGPDTIQAAVQRYSTLRADPMLGKIIQRFETTGEIQRPNGFDSFDEPEPEDPNLVRIRQLEERLVAQETSGGAQAMKGHIEKFFQEFPLEGEVRERAIDKAMGTIKQWHQLGPVGIKSIQNLQSPDGYNTVKGLLLTQLSSEDLKRGLKSTLLRDRGVLEGMRTDSPSGVPSSGKELPADVKTAMQALRYAREHPDRI